MWEIVNNMFAWIIGPYICAVDGKTAGFSSAMLFTWDLFPCPHLVLLPAALPSHFFFFKVKGPLLTAEPHTSECPPPKFLTHYLPLTGGGKKESFAEIPGLDCNKISIISWASALMAILLEIMCPWCLPLHLSFTWPIQHTGVCQC